MANQLTTKQIDQAHGTAEIIKTLQDTASSAFIEREDALHALAIALASGQHLAFLAKPGTAKTKLGDWFGAALGIKYFYLALGIETTLDEIFGPVNPMTLDRQWERVLSGLSTSPLAFLDEIGKAPQEVQNAVLAAMEERKLAVGDARFPIPLHTLIAATNETIDDNPAFFDRFSLRVHIEYISDVSNFMKMLTADVDSPPLMPVTQSDLCNLRHTCHQMALAADSEVTKTVGQLWATYKTKFKDEPAISDRRWRRLLVCAAGQALLNGNTQITVPDLSVGRFMLWHNLDKQQAVGDWVSSLTNREVNAFKEAAALLKEAEAKYAAFPPTVPDDQRVALHFDVYGLQKSLEKHRGRQWEALNQRCAALLNDLSKVPNLF